MDGKNLESRVKSLEVLTSLLLAITHNLHTGNETPLEAIRNLLHAHPDILTEDLLHYMDELEHTAELLRYPQTH